MSKQEMKKNKNPKIVDMLFQGVGALFVSKVVVLGNIFKLNPLEEEEREQTNPMVAFERVFLTQENPDIFPILICRDNRHGQTPLLVDLNNDLESLRIILKHENELSLKVFQEVMIYSCVEVVVDEMKRQCRILRISDKHNTSVRIADDISLLNWIPHFAMHFLNKMRTG